RDSEIRLEVLLRVPGERRDTVAGADPEPAEGGGEALGPLRDLRERRAPHALAIERRDATVGVNAAAVLEERRDRERIVLHRAEQGGARGLSGYPARWGNCVRRKPSNARSGSQRRSAIMKRAANVTT